MIETELIDIIVERTDMIEGFDILREIIEAIEDDPDTFIKNLKDEMIEKCREEECCPVCQNNLEVINTYDEYRGEYFGQPSYETMNVLGCTQCQCYYIEE